MQGDPRRKAEKEQLLLLQLVLSQLNRLWHSSSLEQLMAEALELIQPFLELLLEVPLAFIYLLSFYYFH